MSGSGAVEPIKPLDKIPVTELPADPRSLDKSLDLTEELHANISVPNLDPVKQVCSTLQTPTKLKIVRARTAMRILGATSCCE